MAAPALPAAQATASISTPPEFGPNAAHKKQWRSHIAIDAKKFAGFTCRVRCDGHGLGLEDCSLAGLLRGVNGGTRRAAPEQLASELMLCES